MCAQIQLFMYRIKSPLIAIPSASFSQTGSLVIYFCVLLYELFLLLQFVTSTETPQVFYKQLRILLFQLIMVKIPDNSLIFDKNSNSMTFPCMKVFSTWFPVFHCN